MTLTRASLPLGWGVDATLRLPWLSLGAARPMSESCPSHVRVISESRRVRVTEYPSHIRVQPCCQVAMVRDVAGVQPHEEPHPMMKPQLWRLSNLQGVAWDQAYGYQGRAMMTVDKRSCCFIARSSYKETWKCTVSRSLIIRRHEYAQVPLRDSRSPVMRRPADARRAMAARSTARLFLPNGARCSGRDAANVAYLCGTR
jgi:hypothetical protein